MTTDEQAKAALEKYNNFALGARRIMVNEARPMEPRPAGGYPPRSSPGGAPGAPRSGGFGGGGGDSGRNPNFGADSKAFSERKNRYDNKKKGRGGEGDNDKKGGGKGGKKGKGHDEFDDDGGW